MGEIPHQSEAWVCSVRIGPVFRLLVGVPYVVLTGGIQGLYSGCGTVVVHPTMAIVHSAWATLRYGLRTVRDATTWQFVEAFKVFDEFFEDLVKSFGMSVRIEVQRPTTIS